MRFRPESPGNRDYGDPLHVNRQAIIKEQTNKILSERPKEADFIGKPYSREEVQIDFNRIVAHKRHHQEVETLQAKEQKELANIFEVVVILGISKAKWLGEGVSAQKTSDYDDFENDVDILLRFKENKAESYLGLAADVTFSSNLKVLQKKFVTLEKKIREGTLTQIKYAYPGQEGPLDKVPEIIVGVSGAMVRELADLMAQGKMKELQEHPASILLLLQAKAQLETFKSYALRYGQEEVAGIFLNMAQIIDKLLDQKGSRVSEIENAHAEDVTHKAIMKIAKST